MNKYIDRYVYAVSRMLPKEIREEVEEELKTNILNMLSDNPNDSEIEGVLRELGNPKVLAMNYIDKDKAIVAPVFYSDYLNVLKITMIIFGVVSVIFGILNSIVEIQTTNLILIIFDIFYKTLTSLIKTTLLVFSIVTLIFWIISKNVKDKQLKNWKLNDLPKVKKERYLNINKQSSVVQLIITSILYILWIGTITLFINKVGIYDGGNFICSLFNRDIIRIFTPFFIILLFLSLMSNILKIKYKEWNKKVIITHLIYQLFGTLIVILFVSNKDLLNDNLYTFFISNTEFSFLQINNFFSIIKKGLAILFFVFFGTDLLVLGFKLKTKKIRFEQVNEKYR